VPTATVRPNYFQIFLICGISV